MTGGKNPEEIGVLWRKTCERTGRTLWSGQLEGKEIVAFTFKTHAGREGMSIQISRSRQATTTKTGDQP